MPAVRSPFAKESGYIDTERFGEAHDFGVRNWPRTVLNLRNGGSVYVDAHRLEPRRQLLLRHPLTGAVA